MGMAMATGILVMETGMETGILVTAMAMETETATATPTCAATR
jgi:hypothetical protein